MKKANSKVFIKRIEDLKECNLGQFFSKIKNIGARTGETKNETFTLPSQVELDLDDEKVAEQIAAHFSAISKEFPPISIDSLPERVKKKIESPFNCSQATILEEYEIYEILKKRKQKKSSVPKDIPHKLKKEFLPELAKPISYIFNSISETGIYPKQWLTEFVTPIPKVSPPEIEDDLRNISLTADLSKNYEYILAEWLKPYIMKRMNPGQCGDLNRHSTTHYLIMLYNFILSNTDSSSIRRSVIAALIDFSKAFKQINHSKVIVGLSDWGVPRWLLKILVSYLSGRSMILRYK